MDRAAALRWIEVARALFAIRAALRRQTNPESDFNTRFVAASYHRVLRRIPDAAGLDHYCGTLSAGRQSQWDVVRELITSAERRQSRPGFRSALDTLVAARRALIRHVLPPAEVLVDLGGGATETPEGALRF